jgi:hypothetical protein
VRIAGKLPIRTTRVLNADAEETGDPERIEGNLLEGAISSALGFFAPKSIPGLISFAVLIIFPIGSV